MKPARYNIRSDYDTCLLCGKHCYPGRVFCCHCKTKTKKKEEPEEILLCQYAECQRLITEPENVKRFNGIIFHEECFQKFKRLNHIKHE